MCIIVSNNNGNTLPFIKNKNLCFYVIALHNTYDALKYVNKEFIKDILLLNNNSVFDCNRKRNQLITKL